MSQKKAFVRYAANKAVPGSLIVRTKAPKVGTWKEVPYNLCCNVITNLTFNSYLDGFSLPTILWIGCGSKLIFEIDLTNRPVECCDTPQTAVDYLNSLYSWFGFFSWYIDPLNSDLVIINIAVSENTNNVLCPNGNVRFYYS